MKKIFMYLYNKLCGDYFKCLKMTKMILFIIYFLSIDNCHYVDLQQPEIKY